MLMTSTVPTNFSICTLTQSWNLRIWNLTYCSRTAFCDVSSFNSSSEDQHSWTYSGAWRWAHLNNDHTLIALDCVNGILRFFSCLFFNGNLCLYFNRIIPSGKLYSFLLIRILSRRRFIWPAIFTDINPVHHITFQVCLASRLDRPKIYPVYLNN